MYMTKSNLARTYIRAKNLESAELILHSILQSIPPSHPDWIDAMYGSVYVRVKKSRLAGVEEDCTHMLDKIARENLIALDSPQTIAIVEQLLIVYQAQGRIEDIDRLRNKYPTTQLEPKKKELHDTAPTSTVEPAGIPASAKVSGVRRVSTL